MSKLWDVLNKALVCMLVAKIHICYSFTVMIDETLFEQEVTRKQFLVIVAVFVVGLLGLPKFFSFTNKKNIFERKSNGFSQGTYGGK